MLIRLQGALRVGNSAYKAGDVVDLEETQAILLIKKGLAIKQPVEPKQNIFIKLYGTDAIPMGKLRTEVFREFLNSLKKKYPARPHPDGFMSTCLFCGESKLLINKFTGTTFCYACRRELPFEYLLEMLKNCNIQSIVEEVKKSQNKPDTKEGTTKRPTYNEIIRARR
jgi:hypothetical protein